MSEKIFWVTAAKIKEGEQENLRVLINEMNEYTKNNEPGTVKYEWFKSDDEKYCHLYEHFTDSAAATVHLKSFFKNFGKRFMSTLEVKSFTVYGKPSDELKGMLDTMGVIYMESAGGFTR